MVRSRAPTGRVIVVTIRSMSSLDSSARTVSAVGVRGGRPVVSRGPPNRSGCGDPRLRTDRLLGGLPQGRDRAVCITPWWASPRGLGRTFLATKTELRDDVAVAGDVFALQVLQQPAAAA